MRSIMGKHSTGVYSNSDQVNQDICFAYENFLLLDNLYFFGVCDGHGKEGQFISEHAKYYLPSNIQYLEIENNVGKKNKSINQLIKSLFSLSEKSNVRDTNIIKYLYDKFGINIADIAFVKNSTQQIHSLILESFKKTQEDLKEKNFDIQTSGSTVCSVFITGNNLYCANLGDSRAVLGSFDENEKIWKTNQLSKDHKLNDEKELKRILAKNGSVHPLLNEDKIEVGPPRVWFKNEDSPGLAMSRSLGDYQASKVGVIAEPGKY
jgi:serine/threonine protein phosphatase PrpC